MRDCCPAVPAVAGDVVGIVVVVWVGAGLGAIGAGFGSAVVVGAAGAGAGCWLDKSARHWLKNFGQVTPAGTWFAAFAACHLSPHCFITDSCALALVARPAAAASAIAQTAARKCILTIRRTSLIAGSPAGRVPEVKPTSPETWAKPIQQSISNPPLACRFYAESPITPRTVDIQGLIGLTKTVNLPERSQRRQPRG
jgi:hypothetical protein